MPVVIIVVTLMSRVMLSAVHRRACRTVTVAPEMAAVASVAAVVMLMASASEVATVPAVQHAEVCTSCCGAEVVAPSVVVSVTSDDVPGMSSAIAGVEHRPSEEEVVTVWVACIDGKVPETVAPV